MRYCWPAVMAVLLACGPASAQQQAPANPSFDPSKESLDALLVQWEQKMKAINTLAASVTRTKIDAVFKTTEVFEGNAYYMKPNLALLDLHMKGQQTRFERYVSTGTFLYEYNQATRELRSHELPPPKAGQPADDNFLSFLFGMKAEEAKRRYDIHFMGPGHDANYYYLEIIPRFAADKTDFQKAALALTKGTFLPRLLTIEEPNGSKVQWEIPVVEPGARLTRQHFEQPQLPAGWKAVRVPRQDTGFDAANGVPPRLVRPQK